MPSRQPCTLLARRSLTHLTSAPHANRPECLPRRGRCAPPRARNHRHAAAGAKPLSMNAYKVKLVEVAVKRALLAAAGNRYWEV